MESVVLMLSFSLPIILLTILYYRKHRAKASIKLYPPGPPGLPVIGNLHQFDGLYTHTYLHRLSRQYGPIMSLKLGSRQVLVISSSNVVKEIMKSHDLAFSGRPVVTGLQRLTYNGLDLAFSPYGNMWRELRKICTIHLFSPKQVQAFRPTREDEIRRMIKKITRDAFLAKASNLSEVIISLTSNMICRVAFGKSYVDDDYGKIRFYELLHETQAMMGGFFVRDYLPWLGWIDNISGMVSRLDKNFRELDDFYQQLIEEHLDSNKPETMQGDILDILLGLMRSGDRLMSSVHLTLEHIKALLMNILAGGTDTSAAVIIWAMTALMKNPIIMKKLQTEIRDIGGMKNFIDEDDIVKLRYFKAVVKETFRLYPPGPLLAPRETIHKCTSHSYVIEPGTMVYINAWAIARDPEIWSDPNEFIPERFLESDIDIRGTDPEVIPFGIGRRGCPAISTGMAIVEVVLANLLYIFDWESPPGMKNEDLEFEAQPGMTMHKKNALCLVAKTIKG